jgi:hypothetical protein
MPARSVIRSRGVDLAHGAFSGLTVSDAKHPSVFPVPAVVSQRGIGSENFVVSLASIVLAAGKGAEQRGERQEGDPGELTFGQHPTGGCSDRIGDEAMPSSAVLPVIAEVKVWPSVRKAMASLLPEAKASSARPASVGVRRSVAAGLGGEAVMTGSEQEGRHGRKV